MRLLAEGLSAVEIEKVNQLTFDILENVGVEFRYEPALEYFRRNNFKLDGSKVFIKREQVERALKSAPEEFVLHARNSEKNVTVGGMNTVYVPAYGAPYVHSLQEGRRKAVFEDYNKIAKLSAVCEGVDITGGVLVEPNDIPDKARHVEMLFSCITNSDKVFMGSAAGAKKAKDSVRMAAILFGEREIREKPVMVSLINSITPLIYDDRMLGALMEYAESGQAVIVASLAMAGGTAPATLAGTLVLQNAEILAGITLTQLINPGTPVIYGSASAIMDMNYGTLAIGSPETALLTAASAQLARYYGLPSRGGGSLTDSKIPDSQAGFESGVTLLTTVLSGINFILHAAGILESYNTFSYEKFIIDNEVCRMVKRLQKGFALDEEKLAYDLIAEVGPGGHYLDKLHTYNHFRSELWRPSFEICDRGTYDHFVMNGERDTMERACDFWKKKLSEHEQPYLDKKILKKLLEFKKQVAD